MPKAALRNAANSANPVAIRPSSGEAGGEADGADDREDEADELGELQRRHRLPLGDRAEPGGDERGEHQAVGMLPRTARARRWRTPRPARRGSTAAPAEADGRDQQRDDQDGGGDPGGEAGTAHVDLVGRCAGSVMVDIE